MTMDAFSNPAARIGFGTLDLLQATEYPMTRMTQNYQLLTSLYRENWIIQNIISTIPNDMMRKWYDLRTSVAPEYLKADDTVRAPDTDPEEAAPWNVLGTALWRRGGRDPDQGTQ